MNMFCIDCCWFGFIEANKNWSCLFCNKMHRTASIEWNSNVDFMPINKLPMAHNPTKSNKSTIIKHNRKSNSILRCSKRNRSRWFWLLAQRKCMFCYWFTEQYFTISQKPSAMDKLKQLDEVMRLQTVEQNHWVSNNSMLNDQN